MPARKSQLKATRLFLAVHTPLSHPQPSSLRRVAALGPRRGPTGESGVLKAGQSFTDQLMPDAEWGPRDPREQEQSLQGSISLRGRLRLEMQ